ncbi:hypothetical protein [Undibacterium sp. TS12]|uniref:hypothetical protein n=1 Tax=Undibacterium sp. TS12 TaxID=2908202 RepID=UPI001F4CDF37|nr:hypothetical protein [Undibacterium sp. TS12]MCH8619650.1 hypothetical protein [Undibacterium sp. TS12]
MRVFYQFDYDALSRNVRKQLARSVRNPEHLVYGDANANWYTYTVNLSLCLFCGFLVYLAASADYGDPIKDTAWADRHLLLWYSILFFGIVYGAYAMWQRLQMVQKFHFLPGRYLFPMALIDVRSEKIGIHDLAQLRKLDAIHHETNGRYTKTVFTFNFTDGTRKTLVLTNKNRAEIALEKFNRFQHNARAAFQNRDIASLYGFDPLLDLRKSKWQKSLNDPGRSLGKKILDLLMELKLPLVIVAITFAAIFWYGRNAASDKKMYMTAKQAQTEASYLGYLGHGKFHIAEMQAELPRVVFKEVQKKNSVSALRALKTRFPHTDIQADVNEEIHQLYDKSLQKFRAQAVNSDTGLIKAMEYLLKYAEEHDSPGVTINFARPSPSELSQLDAFLKLKESNLRGMKIIPAAKYFADDSAATRESRITTGIRTAFSSIFPNDVLAFSPGSNTQSNIPMLQIAYQIEPSGKVFTSDRQDDAFVGLVMRFKAAIVVPDVKERWKFDLEVEPPDSFNVEYKTSSRDAVHRAPESQVYAVMAERAFDKLALKINAAFFRPDSAVYIKQLNRSKGTS